MDVLFAIVGVLFVLMMLVLVTWLTDLEQRVRRLEQPRAPLDDTERLLLPPARRRSSGAE